MSDETPTKPSPGSVIDQIIRKSAEILPDQPVIIQVVNWLPSHVAPMEFLIRTIEDFTLGPLPHVDALWKPCRAKEKVNMRFYPSINAPSYGLLAPADVLYYIPEVYKVADGHQWQLVSGKGQFGWVAGEYLEQINSGG